MVHALTDEGNLYSWGCDIDKSGVLGLAHIYNQEKPLLNPNFKKKLLNVSISEKHGAAIDSN